jgi:hypothetical protein
MQYDWRRHPYTNLCRHTGLTIPECSCPACTERRIARANISTQGGRANRRMNTSSRPKYSAIDLGCELSEPSVGTLTQPRGGRPRTPDTKLGHHRAQTKG